MCVALSLDKNNLRVVEMNVCSLEPKYDQSRSDRGMNVCRWTVPGRLRYECV